VSVNAILAHLVAQARQSATAALGPSKFDAESKAGANCRRDDAVRRALGESVPGAIDFASEDERSGLLGERQTDVARLVADGLTNKQIGAQLLISERTVESHVRSIMNKLGFNSRAQIAGWMASSNQ
jgi:DNA-binding NarL/FixJ family response regulator